jgi:hypothetical protein
MAVGTQTSSVTMDQQMTYLAQQLREVMQKISNLSMFVNGQGTGLATLEAIGYNAEDAAAAQSMLSYLNTVAAIYFGTATQPSEFNFNQELSQLWAAS